MSRLGNFKDDWRRRRHARRVRKLAIKAFPLARNRLQVFRRISNIFPAARRDLLPKYIRHVAQVALLRAKEKRTQTFLLIFHLAVVIIPYLFTPFAVTILLSPVLQTFGVIYVVWLWAFSCFASFAIVKVLQGPLLFFGKQRGGILFGLFWIGFGILTCVEALYLLRGHLGSSEHPWYLIVAVSSIVQVLVYFISRGLSLTVLVGVQNAIAAQMVARAPDSMFVDEILQALEFVGRSDLSWMKVSSKNELMRVLEDAARIVSEKLPRALSTADPRTEMWLRSRCDGIAASVRAKKTWVSMPKSDTREQLEKSLAKYFIEAVLGNWDSIETTESPQLVRQEIKLRIRAFVIGVFVAVVPAAVYRGAQSFGVLTPGFLNEYLGFGVAVWAIISTLLAVDPRFGEKIEAFQKVASVILGKKKKDE